MSEYDRLLGVKVVKCKEGIRLYMRYVSGVVESLLRNWKLVMYVSDMNKIFEMYVYGDVMVVDCEKVRFNKKEKEVII